MKNIRLKIEVIQEANFSDSLKKFLLDNKELQSTKYNLIFSFKLLIHVCLCVFRK